MNDQEKMAQLKAWLELDWLNNDQERELWQLWQTFFAVRPDWRARVYGEREKNGHKTYSFQLGGGYLCAVTNNMDGTFTASWNLSHEKLLTGIPQLKQWLDKCVE
jgi:hypothetical protein